MELVLLLLKLEEQLLFIYILLIFAQTCLIKPQDELVETT